MLGSHVQVLHEVARDRDVRLLLLGQYIAQAADGLAQAVLADQLILDPLVKGTPQRIFGLFALTLLPYSLIAPFLGVFVDRWRRRNILVGANAARCLLLISLPIWSLGLPGDLPLYVGILILLGLGRLFLTTKGAVLPVLFHEHHLLRANAISNGGGMISALIGGVIGVVSIGPLSSSGALVVGGIAYGTSSLLVRRISKPLGHGRGPIEGFLQAIVRIARELAEGLTAIWVRPRARWPLSGIFILRTIGMFVAIAAIVIIKTEFPDVGDQFGRRSASALALGAAGAGAFAGAVTAPTLGRWFNKARLTLLGFAISGVAVIVLGGIAAIAAVVVLTFIAGYGGFIAKIAVDAQVQEAIPDELRGRAFAFYDILYNFASVVAGFVMVILQDTPLRRSMIGAGACALLIAGLLGRAMSRAGMLTRSATD